MKFRSEYGSGSTSTVRFVERTAAAGGETDSVSQELDWDGPRYHVVRELGSGGMGTVHEVFDLLLSRGLAAKFVRADVKDQEGLSTAFLDEARVTAQLEHPNVIPVHDLGFDPERGLYFCMRLVEGRSYLELLLDAHGKPLSRRGLRELLSIFLRIVDVVSFAHGRGIVHRDLKPDNVLVGTHGQVYLTDWGVALVKDPVLLGRGVSTSEPFTSRSPAFAGTVAYMAPEQANARVDDIDARTDVYGLGGILHFLLTGTAPHEDSNALRAFDHAKKGLVHPLETRSAWPEIPPGLVEIALKALSPDPFRRYQTAAALALDVGMFLDGGGWFATRVYDPGAVVVREGEWGDTAYIVAEGTCSVSKRVGGEEAFVRNLGPGDVFGETAALTTRIRTATVTATDRVVVKVVTREALESELAGSPWLAAFMKSLVERFVELEKKLGDSAFPPPPTSPRRE